MPCWMSAVRRVCPAAPVDRILGLFYFTLRSRVFFLIRLHLHVLSVGVVPILCSTASHPPLLDGQKEIGVFPVPATRMSTRGLTSVCQFPTCIEFVMGWWKDQGAQPYSVG
jgi:hypothetical protein